LKRRKRRLSKAKGFRIRKVYAESFRKAFPEIPSELVELIIEKEGKGE
jgi:hypothetical protein